MDFIKRAISIIAQLAKSKTVILAWLTFAVGVLGYVAGQDVIKQNPEIVAFIVTVIGGLQFVIRLFTSVPIGSKRSLLKSK